MIHERTFLGRSLALSLLLHAAAISGIAQLALPPPRISPPAQPELKVSLRDPLIVPDTPVPAPRQVTVPPRAKLMLPRESPRNPGAAVLLAPDARPAAPSAASPPRLTGEAALKAAEQLQRELLYPREAIERGLQGEALVLLFLDASGNAIAARLEASSGHQLLDDAAVRAARTLRALPDSAPRDVLLPVRFRLR
jgi:periplasmic protein TonB